MTMFNRFPRRLHSGAHKEINSFAPEFWRLLQESTPVPDSPSARELPPPPLTNDALERLRDGMGSRGNDLYDIPPPPPPPAALPPLTNESFQGLRNPLGGSGDLRDIPSPRPEHLPPFYNPEIVRQAGDKLREIHLQRRNLEKMQIERDRPERLRDVDAFDLEIRSLRQKIESLEDEFGAMARHLPGQIVRPNN